jgi:sulfofructose kinase
VGHQAAFGVEVVDTTGAGDVFHGAFAYGLAQGWPSAKCVEFASAVAALSCRALGGRRGIPTVGAALRYLGDHGSGDWAE